MTESHLFNTLPAESQKILDSFDSLIQDIKPLNSRQLAMLPQTIRDLSHQLTDERSTRRTGYMNDTVQLSSYVRYYMWWNLERLTHLFSGFDSSVFNSLTDGSYAADLGSGPLTVPCALWLSRPELRSRQITWYCIDYSQNALTFGEEIFLSMAARTMRDIQNQQQSPWKIIRIKGDFGTEIRNKASFVTCANMFNELYWNSSKPLEESAKKYTQQLLSYTAGGNKTVLVVEPGVPRSSRFVTLLRDAFLRKGWSVASPCPHSGLCALDGRRGGKWCHFILSTENAPKKLHTLSKNAGLPKDRAALSFMLAVSDKPSILQEHTETQRVEPKKIPVQNIPVRIVSDPIFLSGGRIGKYACSQFGLTLVIEKQPKLVSGDLISVPLPSDYQKKAPVDQKTGAVIISI